MTVIMTELIKQLNGSVFTLLALLLAMFWVIYNVGGWAKTFKHHEDKIKDLGSLLEKVIRMETKIELIYINTNRNPVMEARSPISLTDIGNKIVGNIRAEATLDKYFSRMEPEIGLGKVDNAYDIQMEAIKYAKEKMIKFLDANELNVIKTEAFARGMIIEDIMSVFGILIRNRILKNKEIPVSDVDEHQKKKK